VEPAGSEFDFGCRRYERVTINLAMWVMEGDANCFAPVFEDEYIADIPTRGQLRVPVCPDFHQTPDAVQRQTCEGAVMAVCIDNNFGDSCTGPTAGRRWPHGRKPIFERRQLETRRWNLR
jgi:hypothetical protein